MCGLCGVLSPELTQDDIAAFQHLMIVSTLRGQIGSGVAAVPRKLGAPVTIVKHETLSAAELVYGADFHDARKKKLACLMGHARAPTSGGLTPEDTHPFQTGNIIGTHNGTMTVVNGEKIGQKDNDSRMIFENISQRGIDETVKNSVGPFALAYIDKGTGELCFLRNEGRTLYFAILEGKTDTLFWASEASFLRLVLRRRFPVQEQKIFSSHPDQFLSFRLHNQTKSTIGYVNKREIKPDLPIPKADEKPTTIHSSVPAIRAHGNGTLHMYKTGEQHYAAEDEIKLMLAAGCSYCGYAQTWQSFVKHELLWTKKDEFVCSWCASTDDTARDYVKSFGLTLPPALVVAH